MVSTRVTACCHSLHTFAGCLLVSPGMHSYQEHETTSQPNCTEAFSYLKVWVGGVSDQMKKEGNIPVMCHIIDRPGWHPPPAPHRLRATTPHGRIA